MGLSNDLISQFVKITKDTPKPKKETTSYGVVVKENGKTYVRLDGATELTPVSNTANADTNDRVIVMIKNHAAVITGNLTSPSARLILKEDGSKTVEDIDIDKITDFEILLASKASVKDLETQTGRIDNAFIENATIRDNLSAAEAAIEELVADDVTIKGNLEAANADIDTLKTSKLDAGVADVKFAEIGEVYATKAQVYDLDATHGEFERLMASKFESAEASIKELDTEKLSAEEATMTYANIDFSNIGKAAIEHFLANSGLVENVVVGDGFVTGTLVGVTIKGDLIEGNTVVADKLVIRGEDGLFYKLNAGIKDVLNVEATATISEDVLNVEATATISEDVLNVEAAATIGASTSVEQTEYNSLHGSAIMAKTITATQVNVDDLVAFDATIGGFTITEDSIYSDVKDSYGNTTRGIHFSADGQMNVGDEANFIKYYKDEDGTYKLAISAASILYALNGKQYSIADLGPLGEYVHIGTYDDEPCIELGESDSDFKLVITNTRILFMEGSSVPAHINNQSLHITKAVIEEEIQQGQYVWKVRANGNLGLMWKGGD